MSLASKAVWVVGGAIVTGLAVLAAREWGIVVMVGFNTAVSVLGVWIANGAANRADEVSDDLDQARGPIAPAYVPDGHWAPAHAAYEPLQPDPGPITEPIPALPATVPDMKAAAKVRPLPRARTEDEWVARMRADTDNYIRKIRGGTA